MNMYDYTIFTDFYRFLHTLALFESTRARILELIIMTPWFTARPRVNSLLRHQGITATSLSPLY